MRSPALAWLNAPPSQSLAVQFGYTFTPSQSPPVEPELLELELDDELDDELEELLDELLDDDELEPLELNCHQFMLNRKSPEPVNRKYRSWVPVAPVTGQETLVQLCQPPVLGTAQVPSSVPFTPPTRSSIFPPFPSEATLAVKDEAPVPKATPVTLT